MAPTLHSHKPAL